VIPAELAPLTGKSTDPWDPVVAKLFSGPQSLFVAGPIAKVANGAVLIS
jgi:hypothetical protein